MEKVLRDFEFNATGSSSDVDYEIIIEPEKGQLVSVSNCSPQTIDYKLNRIKRLFPKCAFFIRRKETTVFYSETVKDDFTEID